jgi:hypothetical protein
MAMPRLPASKFGIGFAMARETRLLVTANVFIVMNRIVEEWTNGRWVKCPPTNLYNGKNVNIYGHIRDRDKTNDA